jgi:hypothetical protein
MAKFIINNPGPKNILPKRSQINVRGLTFSGLLGIIMIFTSVPDSWFNRELDPNVPSYSNV